MTRPESGSGWECGPTQVLPVESGRRTIAISALATRALTHIVLCACVLVGAQSGMAWAGPKAYVITGWNNGDGNKKEDDAI